jgi:WD40 repeat protein
LQARTAAEEQARIAESRRLTTESASAFPKHPQLSLLLAVEAVKIGQSLPQVQETVRQSLTEALDFVRGRPLIGGRPLVVSHTDISAMAISSDNHWLVTSGSDNVTRLWDLTAKDPAANPVVLRGHGGSVDAVEISPDNHWLVTTGSSDNTARLWDLRAKDWAANPVMLRGHEGAVYAVAISPDNHWLATGSSDNTARLWDLTAKDPAANQWCCVAMRARFVWWQSVRTTTGSRAAARTIWRGCGT